MPRKSSKKEKNAKLLIPGLVLIVIILVVVLLLSASQPQKRDCNTFCKENNFSGAVENSCMIFTKCLAPNYPLTNNKVKGFCNGNFDVCCCKP